VESTSLEGHLTNAYGMLSCCLGESLLHLSRMPRLSITDAYSKWPQQSVHISYEDLDENS